MSVLRCAITGTGVRALSLAWNILEKCQDLACIVGLHDTNPLRMEGFNALLGRPVPMYTDLARMAIETRPQVLIICTPDATHPTLIEQAFALGLEVICEKPLAIDDAGILQILAIERQYQRQVRVAFNLRYSPFALRIRQLLAEGAIGRVLGVHAEWFIDRTHGTEYFRRWHAYQAQSGGLFVHKASHHFDLINWWLDSVPVAVSATGSRQIYGDAGAFRGSHCRACPHRDHCWAAMRSLDLQDADLNPHGEAGVLQRLYFQAENVDGYLRDRCVFDPSIDIYDTMTAQIRYREEQVVSYHLTAYAPYQGYRVVFNGSAGRIEAERISAATLPPQQTGGDTLRVITGTNRQDVHLECPPIPHATGAHDGGDDRMLRHLLDPHALDPFGQTAGSEAGAASTLIGSAANRSCRAGGWVTLPAWQHAESLAV